MAITAGRTRIIIGVLVFGLVLFLLMARLAEVSVLRGPKARPVFAVNEVPSRADIVDRNGEILATTLETYSLYAEPSKVWDPVETTEALLAALPDLDPAVVEARLSSNKSFIFIKRNLTPRERQAVFTLGMPGLGFRVEPRRVYPRGKLASHVLGWTDVDMIGAAGSERAFDLELSAPDAAPKKLSIDMRIQFALDDELRKGMERFAAKAVSGVVLDIHTGEILAMASMPDFDPNQFGTAMPQTRLNRATMATYELGSTFKPITMALALEAGADPEIKLPVQKPVTIRRKTINDDHKSNVPMGMFDILANSSNRGAALYALGVGEAGQRDFLRRLGLFDRAPIELAETAAPQLPREWQDLTTATVSYGHGIAVTPLALASALSALVNGGEYVAPTLQYVSLGQEVKRRRVIAPSTASTMTDMMRYVVTDGTGRNAAVRGYGVMGKTGTAEKPGINGYQKKKLVSSFVAAFPYSDPQYLVFIAYDEPQPAPGTYGYATAGWNAAPTAGAVVSRMVSILGMKREAPTQLAHNGGQQ
jgi:cell division protein FtsI (penicillin-binding protein 3)